MAQARFTATTDVPVQVLYFAVVRDHLRKGSEAWRLPACLTEVELKKRLATRHPAIAAHLPSCRIAVNGEFVAGRLRLKAGDELAVLPPVAGG